MKQKTILVDCDDVLLGLVPKWLESYNYTFGDNLKPSDIKSWDLTKYVKKECGKYIYKMLTEELYDLLEAVDGALSGISALETIGYKIIYLTAFHPITIGAKFSRMSELGFNVTTNNFISATDKSLIGGNYLIDDNFDNVMSARGKGVLFTREWNKINDFSPRVDNWDDVINFFVSEIVNGKDREVYE